MLQRRMLFPKLFGLTFGLLVTACGGDVGTEVTGASREERCMVGSPMSIEGTVLEVMESWPLQLTIDSQGSHYHVVLRPEAAITRRDMSVDASELRPGARVRVQGKRSGQSGMSAYMIDILSE